MNRPNLLDDFLAEAKNTLGNNGNKKKERKLFFSEVKKVRGRINSDLTRKPNLDEASRILNQAGYKFAQEPSSSDEEKVIELARAYGAILIGLDVMRNSPNEQPKEEVEYFLNTVRKGFLNNYSQIDNFSKNYLGLKKDPLAFIEKTMKNSLEGEFSYANNKTLLREELAKTGIGDFQPATKSGLEGSLAIISLIGSVFFISTNFTGNVIAGYSPISANISSTILFILGVFLGFLYFKKK